jgi:EmrB/QacA subfamily drug resistance transporter
MEDSPYATERSPRLRFLIPMVVACAFFMENLDTTILTTAIPRIAEELDTSVLHLSLAVTAYVLTLAIFIPVSGWFADRYGIRRIFTLSLLVFTASSILCGMAHSLTELVLTRCLQGVGGAMMTPVGRLILLRSFPRRQFMTAIAYVSLPALIGPAMGPLLGGVLTTYVSWRWIFFVNVPFGLLGIVLAQIFIEDHRSDERVGFDFAGFLLVGAGFSLLQLGFENLSRSLITPAASLTLIILGAVSLFSFGLHARRRAAPVVDLSLFKVRGFRIGTLAGGICRVGSNGVPFLLPLMLQVGMGLSPIQSGSLTFCASLGAMVVRAMASRALRRFGFRSVLLVTGVLSAAFIAGFSFVAPGTSHIAIAAYIFFFGLVRSLQFMTSNALAYSDVPSEQLSSGTSLGGVLQQLSISIGVSIAALVLGILTGGQEPITLANFHETFLIMAIIPLLGIPGFLTLRVEDGVSVSGHKAGAAGKSGGANAV